MTLQTPKTPKLIDGYTAVELIGTGAYGEVWKAETSGGLNKAIKMVYGYLDDERAARELKALERIKEVRHPFLLSLERIEVIDRRLVIVTELAERSLNDRFAECLAAGDAGIARDELLIYLQDAADALDYMRENHSLQHLDVKPENLLLVGGRVKVADFGLVKDLQEVNHSVVGGMTPVYAAPELFDGRASEQSDQYSLAVVYQHMLTGVLPFEGATPSQLAAHHLRSRPCLDSLPAEDRATIARGLSRKPDDRFPSCRALAQALLQADGAAPTRITDARPQPHRSGRSAGDARDADVDSNCSASNPAQSAETPATPTHVLPQGSGHSSAGGPLPPSPAFIPATSVECARLAPIASDGVEAGIRPTLFLGIGGTGIRTLAHLRRRLTDRLAEADELPAWQMLLLDTDRGALKAAHGGAYGAVFAPHETLSLPLRRPKEYGSDSTTLLRWLGRRWLYNIPRTLETAGLRPLGRLALVDHASRTIEHLQTALERIIDPSAIDATAKRAKLAVRSDVPRVVLVGSISGGTAGGMLTDLAYAVRALLARLNVSDADVSAFLTHSTSRRPSEKDLAIASARACLAEIRHCSQLGNQSPEDATYRVPTFEAAAAPFEHAYLIHLGDDLTEAQFDAQTETLAEYLYCDAATPAGALLDASRRCDPASNDAPAQEFSLRTFGLARCGGLEEDIPTLATDYLCRTVLHRWFDSQDGPADAALAVPASDSSPQAVVETERGGSEDIVLAEVVDEAADLRVDRRRALTGLVDQALGSCAKTRIGALAKRRVAELVDALPVDFDAQDALDWTRRMSLKIAEAAKRIQGLRAAYPEIDDPASNHGENASGHGLTLIDSPMVQALQERMPQLADSIQNELLLALLDPTSGGQPAEDAQQQPPGDLCLTLRAASEQAVVRTLEELGDANSAELERIAQRLGGEFDAATPRLRGCGGGQRLWVLLPDALERAGLAEAIQHKRDEQPQLLPHTLDEAVLCVEAEQLSLARAACVLTKDRPDLDDAADRLHTRTDIDWLSLPRFE